MSMSMSHFHPKRERERVRALLLSLSFILVYFRFFLYPIPGNNYGDNVLLASILSSKKKSGDQEFLTLNLKSSNYGRSISSYIKGTELREDL